jgi:hypothetical protein
LPINRGYWLLEELKRLGEQQLETKLDILEILLSLPTTEKKDLENWYWSHPYYKGISEVVDIVRRGPENQMEKLKRRSWRTSHVKALPQ